MSYQKNPHDDKPHCTPQPVAAVGMEHSRSSSGERLGILDPLQARDILSSMSPSDAATSLRSLSPDRATLLFSALEPTQRATIIPLLPKNLVQQWEINSSFPANTVGQLMDPCVALYRPDTLVSDTIADLRELIQHEFVTYAYVVDPDNIPLGLVVMRNLLFAQPDQTLDQIMMPKPFTLSASTKIMDAMKQVLTRHYPVYPVVSDAGRLIGLVRGFRLFEAQAIEISAQAGSMVGVEKGERISTHWLKSFTFRHPWLQLNLLTAFIAGAVVNLFQNTIDQIVVLAAFLPVLAGQSGNTGCQALAVTLRGMTLGELDSIKPWRLVFKEGFLGMLNGFLVGISAGVGMYILASAEKNPNALLLSGIVVAAMIGSCMISGLSGALVPLALRKLGADPATASSIFLTTATDVASMGMLLGLATLLML